MPKVEFLKGRAPTILAVVAGTVASIIIFTAIRDHQSSEANVAFSLQASSHANIIVEGFSRAFFAIESVGALYGSSDSISSSQFDDFVAPLLARFPTITALGWAPEVRQSERAEFEQSTQTLFPGFLITERSPRNQMVAAAERQVYFPVHFIRPYEGNEAARGFDLYSNEIRRAAIDQARVSGQTTSTARIRLVQGMLTISRLTMIRMVTSPTRESSLDQFIHAVDIALYLAKQQGRNRTVVDKTMSQAALNKDAS